MTLFVDSLVHPDFHDQGYSQEFTVGDGDGNVYLSSWVSVGQGSSERLYFKRSLLACMFRLHGNEDGGRKGERAVLLLREDFHWGSKSTSG